MSDAYDLGPDLREVFPPGSDPDRAVLACCLTLIEPEEDGWALEFGTGSGETAAMIAATGVPTITFDSFKGLPENWRPDFRKGAFAQEPPSDIPGVTIVPGWFADTLPGYDWPERVSLIHMDADLYASTATVLSHIEPVLRPGVIIVFDEWFGFDDDLTTDDGQSGEAAAWREFAEPWIEWEVLGHGREQWAIRLTRVNA